MSNQSGAALSIKRYSASDPAIRTAIGKKTADLICINDGPGHGLFGPYVRLEAGPCVARIVLDGVAKGQIVADLVAEQGNLQLVSRRIDLTEIETQVIELRTVLPSSLSDCEVRIYCEDKVRINITAVEIESSSSLSQIHDPELSRRIENFTTKIAPHVQGWVGHRMHQIVEVIGAIFIKYNISGHIAEIGVHHGLSFFLFNVLRRKHELCFAIDLFGDQHLNIDNSGMGSRSRFESHLDALLPHEKTFVRIIERDSLKFSFQEFTGLFTPTGVKLFSIDGGHTAVHVCNDLTLVQEVLVPGGFVALDDFFGPHWPSVTDGFYQFMATRNRRLRPILFFQNKLFLTTVSEHDLWLENLKTWLRDVLDDDEFHAGHWKQVEIAGSQVLSHGLVAGMR
ncbi:MAG: class I SAM-dependent methyltransferase [Alphaproteobacteria bacterium]